MDIFNQLADAIRPEKKQNLTVTISQDGEVKKVFERQETDFCALKYLHHAQGQSCDWALKYGGWAVEVKDNETGEIENWKPYSHVNK